MEGIGHMKVKLGGILSVRYLQTFLLSLWHEVVRKHGQVGLHDMGLNPKCYNLFKHTALTSSLGAFERLEHY
eukprot:5889671-Ditylum_brightwellii.AAC.1